MREQLRDPMVLGTLTLDVDTAVGVAVHPDHGDDPDALLQRADLAANAAKVLPVGVQLFHPALESRAVRRLGLAGDLRRALDNDELEVYFQPKVTLARPAPGRRRVPGPLGAPGARRGGPGGLRRGRRAHRPARPAHRGGADGGPAALPASGPTRTARSSIAVNLSARTLLDPDFPDQVQRAARASTGSRRARLTFEITEAGMLGDIDRAAADAAPAARPRAYGCRSTTSAPAYSSLSYLRRLPVHEVKIDDSFVQGMATDSGRPGDRAGGDRPVPRSSG